jgi:uncharacterized protein YecT (DUF1311 family)
LASVESRRESGHDGGVRFLLLAAVCALAPGAADAEDGPRPSVAETLLIKSCLADAKKKKGSYQECVGRAVDLCLDSGETRAVFECQAEETVIWDDLLDGYYKELGKILSKTVYERLREVQRMWVRYRDAKCSFNQALDGVSEYLKDQAEQGCRLKETARRSDELERLRDWRAPPAK